jgi:Ca2+-binding RTX toxin-like protein
MMKYLACGLLGVAIALVSAGPGIAAPDLVGYWRFDEGAGTAAADSAGFGNVGTLSGGASWTEGMFGSGVSFDGAPGGIIIPRNPWHEPPEITVGGWVRHLGTQGRYKYIVSKGATGCNAASYGLYTGSEEGLQFYVSTDAGHSYTASPDAATGVWDGEWHYAAGTFDGARVRLYVDGAQVGSGTPMASPIDYATTDSTDLYVGAYASGNQCTEPHDFSGDVDDLRIWRVALSADEIGLAMKPLPSDTPPPPEAECTVAGTDGDDVLVGTAKRDVICGLAGDDVLRGLRGNDVLLGGPGADRLLGGRGDDTLEGGGRRDGLVGGKGRDTMLGGHGRDLLLSRDGVRDLVNGNSGRDWGRIDRGVDRRVSVEQVR